MGNQNGYLLSSFEVFCIYQMSIQLFKLVQQRFLKKVPYLPCPTLMQKHLMRTINPGYSQIHCFATGLDYGFPGVPLVCGSSKKGVRLPQHQGLIAVARSK